MFAKTYEIVLTAASFDDLKKKLAGVFIDERKEGNPLITVAAQLAIDGKDEQVDWLRLLGADVDAIAYGYALAKAYGKVEKYRIEHKARPYAIAQGFAFAGEHERVARYRNDYRASTALIAESYAQAGNHAQVDAYRTLYKVHVDDIAKGYALAGNHEQVEAYRIDYKARVNTIARAYAFSGRHQQVETYRFSHNASVDVIANGYAEAGNHERVEAYRVEHKASVDAIVRGYAWVGNHERVEAYRIAHKISDETISQAYGLAGNHGKYCKYAVRDLLASYLTQRTAIKDSSGETKQYFYGSFFFFFQKSFTQKRDAVEALRLALDGKKVDLMEHLSTLRNGKLGDDLRRLIKLGQANDLVDREVNTVSDFIQALHDKVYKHQENSFTNS